MTILVTILYDYNHVQGAEQSPTRSGEEGERSGRRERRKRKRTCSSEGEKVEGAKSAGNVVLFSSDEIVENMAKDQADPGQRVVEDNHDSDGGAALVLQGISESDKSSQSDSPGQDQRSPVPWREPKRGRKIQTTSLSLRRRKKIKRRHKHREPVLRLRGGAAEPSEERELLNVFGGSFQGHPGKSRQSLRSLERPYLWITWEQDRQMLRPPPLDSPREPNLEYLNMSVDEVANEDGIEHYDLAKDAYRRTDSQVRVVKKAQRDQRKVAGGIYQCREDGKDNLYLHIMKGGGKLLGIKLVRFKHPEKPRVEFETFAQMDYERYVQCSSQRFRVNLPEETETGFIWYGHGGNKHPLSSSVYKFCERVDNNIHYSASGCERVTQAPGASQLLCSNKSCGIIFWHLSVMFFQRVKANHFEEAGQEHFAVMMLKSKENVLLWTDKDGNQTRWTRLEHSPLYEYVQVFATSLERIRYVVAEALLPQCNFSLPAYSPVLTTWDEPQPFKRIPSTCTW